MAKKNKICNLFIIDASGSMNRDNKIGEVRGELKRLFKDIKEDKDVKSTTIVFDFASSRDFNVVINTKDTKELTDEIADSLTTRGLTALYDAIGISFNLVKDKYDGVFVSILTDGLENDSNEFTLADIKSLIESKRKLGWAIVFSGTSEAALEEARKMGMSMGNTVKYADNAEGVKLSASTRSAARGSYIKGVMASSLGMEGVDADNLVNQ